MKEFEMALPLFLSSGKGKIKNSVRDTKDKTAEIFRELFSPVKRHLYNFIFKSLNFSEDANDIYQETVLRAFKYFRRFDRTKPFKPWIFSIAANEINRYFSKKNSFCSEKSINDLCDNLPVETDKELVNAVYIVAEELKPQDRQVFFLFYDNGFSGIEIADMVGIKSEYIKVILSNARKKIKKLLEV